MSGRLSQAEREGLARQDLRALFLPLQMTADRNAMLVHTRHTARLLKERQASSPSACAVAHVNGLFDRSIPEAAQKAPACRQGCAHCCRQPVALYAPELFFLAAHIHGRDGMAEKLRQALQDMRGQPQGKWDECLLLENEACSAYAARPLSCHAFVSLDVNDCISTFRYLKERTIRLPQVYNAQRNLCRVVLLAATKAVGLPIHAYELNRASLSAILAQENAEKYWLRGEDVLANLEVLPPGLPPEVEVEIDRLAAKVAAAL